MASKSIPHDSMRLSPISLWQSPLKFRFLWGNSCWNIFIMYLNGFLHWLMYSKCILNVFFCKRVFISSRYASPQYKSPPNWRVFNTFSKWEKKTTKVEQKAVEYYRQYLGTGLWAFYVYHYSHRANSSSNLHSLPAGPPPASAIHRVNSIFFLLSYKAMYYAVSFTVFGYSCMYLTSYIDSTIMHSVWKA